MAERHPPSQAIVDDLLRAFRRELNAHADNLFGGSNAGDSRRPATSPTMAPRESGLNGSGRQKRVVVNETPRYYNDYGLSQRHGLDDDDLEPLPIQTPSAPTSIGRTQLPPTPVLRSTSPNQPRQPSVAGSSNPEEWKASVNHLLDTIEASTGRAATLEVENARLEEKVDVLTRDFANLQTDLVEQKNENEVLKKSVEDLRQVAYDKDQLETENEDLKRQLRDARIERDDAERQMDKLRHRLREYEQYQYEQRPSSNPRPYNRETAATSTSTSGADHDRRFYRGNGGVSTGQPDQGNNLRGYTSNIQEGPPRSTPSGRFRYDRGESYASRSPGEELVHDLHEKTRLDPAYLAPLSDLLDKRLGRDSVDQYRGATPSSRRKQNYP